MRHTWIDTTLRIYRKFSLRSKMMLGLVLIIVFVCVIISIYYYRRTSAYIRTSQDKNFTELMNQTQISLNNMISGLEDTAKYIILNETLEKILLKDKTTFSNSLADQIEDYNYLSRYINTAVINENIEFIRLYFISNSIYTRENLRFFHVSEAERKPWYERAVFTNGVPVWEHNGNEIVCAKAILNYKLAESDCGFIEVVLNRDSLYNVLDNVRATSQGSICLVDDFGNVLTVRGDHKEQFAEFVLGNLDSLRQEANGHDLILEVGSNRSVVSRRLANNWLVVASQSYQAAWLEIRGISFDIFYICAIALILATFFVLFLAMGITIRIKRLSAFMSAVNINDTNYATEESMDELSTVEKSFNHMLRTARESIQNEKEALRLKDKADFDVLQEQVNPHFLYNCLDSINWLAIEFHVYEISNMIQLLSKFFRLGLGKGRQIIPLADELEHARLYIEIMRIRFDGNLETDYQISVNPATVKTLKFILQPLIENAIIHGISGKRSQSGCIIIKCKNTDEFLCISVSDNGIGIHPEKLEKLQEDINVGTHQSGFGLYNVNQRIRLHFGGEYTLKLESEYGKGTKVTAFLPKSLR